MSIKVKVEMGDMLQRAERAAEDATRAVMAELNAAFVQSFTAEAWNWPRDLPTRKLNGATLKEKLESYQKGEGVKAGNPRNIIDSAHLRSTGAWEMTDKFEAVFTWSADYAAAVHEGARIYPWGNRPGRKRKTASSAKSKKRKKKAAAKAAKRVILPARPWTSAVLGSVIVADIEPYPAEERLRDVWLVKFKSGR